MVDDPISSLKEQLAELVVERLAGWSQIYAAELLGTEQPRVSDRRNNRLSRFSLEQLIRFVTRVGGSVELEVNWGTRHSVFFDRSGSR